MIARGYVAEGYGTTKANMCALASGQPDPQFRASAGSPFTPGCDGVAATGVLYANAEVEPMLAVNPINPSNLIGVWQQDRWSDGGARGLVTGYSFDAGRTWTRTAAAFTRCSGGNATNGGDYARASDPWVTFAPDGTAYQSSLSFNGQEGAAGSSSAILVSRSIGRRPHVERAHHSDPRRRSGIQRQGRDHCRCRPTRVSPMRRGIVSPAIWVRVTSRGPPTVARRGNRRGPSSTRAPTIRRSTTRSWCCPNGTLINFFTLFDPNPSLAVIRSSDKGTTWSAPVIIAAAQALGVQDPENGTGVRDSAALGSIAVSRQGTLVVTWQDSRFSSGARDGIALSRSTDGGNTWSAPARVNSVPSVQAFSPTVALRDDGTIGVTYYDFRNNTADPSTLLTDVWLAQSSDGVNWSEGHVSRTCSTFRLRPMPKDCSSATITRCRVSAPRSSRSTCAPTTATRKIAPMSIRGSSTRPERRRNPLPIESAAMTAATAPSLAITPELSERLQTAARRVLARRVPAAWLRAARREAGNWGQLRAAEVN